MSPEHRSRIIALAVILACSAPSQGQPADARTPEQKLGGLDLASIRKYDRGTLADQDAIRDLIVPAQNARAFIFYALPQSTVTGAFKDFLKTVEAARVDQQLGANPSAGGAGGTVAKAGVTSLVSFAMESGALTQTINQNVTTLHANGDGLYRFLTNQEVVPTCVSSDTSCQPGWARNLDLSASFNVSGSGTKTLTGETTANTPVDLSALFGGNQFSSATLQYAVHNSRDLRSDAYRQSFRKWFDAHKMALHDAGRALGAAIRDLLGPVSKFDNAPGTPDSSPYSRWGQKTSLDLAGAAKDDPSTLAGTLAGAYDGLISQMRALDPQFDTKLQAAFQSYVKYFSTLDQLGGNMITTPQFMLLATYSEPPLQPRILNAKLSYARSPGSQNPSKCGNAPTNAGAPTSNSAIVSTQNSQTCANPGTFTFNLGVDLFEVPQPTGMAAHASRFRDAQAALQFDRPLGSATSAAQFSLGAYYQYQLNRGVFMAPAGAAMAPNTNIPLPANGATVLTNTRGSLYVIQAMITVQIPSAGIKMPIGISFSNKTDLLPGNEIRGHIGFTFNSEAPLLNSKPSQ